MKKLLLGLVTMAMIAVFSIAIAGNSPVTLPQNSESTSMLFMGIGLFLLAKLAEK